MKKRQRTTGDDGPGGGSGGGGAPSAGAGFERLWTGDKKENENEERGKHEEESVAWQRVSRSIPVCFSTLFTLFLSHRTEQLLSEDKRTLGNP